VSYKRPEECPGAKLLSRQLEDYHSET